MPENNFNKRYKAIIIDKLPEMCFELQIILPNFLIAFFSKLCFVEIEPYNIKVTICQPRYTCSTILNLVRLIDILQS